MCRGVETWHFIAEVEEKESSQLRGLSAMELRLKELLLLLLFLLGSASLKGGGSDIASEDYSGGQQDQGSVEIGRMNQVFLLYQW